MANQNDLSSSSTATCTICGPNFYGACTHYIPMPELVFIDRPRVLGRHEPMPQTIEGYKEQQRREGELILKMKDEISALKTRNDRLTKKLLYRKNNRSFNNG